MRSIVAMAAWNVLACPIWNMLFQREVQKLTGVRAAEMAQAIWPCQRVAALALSLPALNLFGAQHLFKGHYQPHLHGELGLYDLSIPEVRAMQAAPIPEHGIDGFCCHHYWFNDERLLKRPFNKILASVEPEFPFCLWWKN